MSCTSSAGAIPTASYYFKVPELVSGSGDLGLVQLSREDVARMVQREDAA